METDLEWKTLEGSAAPQRTRRIEKLAYRAPGTTSVPAQGAGPASDAELGVDFAKDAEQAAALRLEQRLREVETAATAGLEQARREGRDNLDRAQRQAAEQARLAQEAIAGQVAAALASFHGEREAYFARVEQEVVRLALAIAARILNREAQLDPLLLSGAVRVALEQLGETTGVRLRCPAGEAERWRELLRLVPRTLHPEVVGDPALGAGDCILEAAIGSVDLGVRAQLAEIERGFFDLLEQRPGAAARRPPEPAA